MGDEATLVADASAIRVGGPFYEDIQLGQVFDAAPGLTLTTGHAALHQAIVGDRLRLPLDAALAARVLPDGQLPAHPALVCDIAIGQSTLATQRVVANLFYPWPQAAARPPDRRHAAHDGASRRAP